MKFEREIPMDHGHIRSVRQITKNRYLNFFEVEAVKRNGDTFPYYLASRAENTDELYLHMKETKSPDGVTIFGLYGESKDRVVLVRQFRYPVGDYVYELPAGLVEQGEDIHEAAVREMKEETGLTFRVVRTDPWQDRAYFMTDGMTDEACSYAYGICTGTVSIKGLEETEDLQVILADREEARRILREERVALSCAMMLMRFITDEDPFAFLKVI